MNIRSRSTLFPVAALALGGVALASVVSCTSRRFNNANVRSTGTAAPSQDQTVCLSIQGNGEKFPALFGEVAALMDRKINPVMIQGGSSASITAATLRGVLSNPSVRDTEILGSDGTPLTHAQKAALVVTSFLGPSETFLFLPSLNRLAKMLRSIAEYTIAVKFADAFIGLPSQEIAHVEAVTSQGALMADFAMNADFSNILKESDFKKRNAMTMDLWVKFGDLMFVTPAQFLGALLSAPPKPGERATAEQAFNEKVKIRYFEIFRNEDMRPEIRNSVRKDDKPAESLAAYNKLMSVVGKGVARIPPEKLEEAFTKAIQTIANVPFIGTFALTATKPFYLPSHERLWNAYNGRTLRSLLPPSDPTQSLLVKTGDTNPMLSIPSGTVLHTTARKASKRFLLGNVEKTGLDGFYMVYYPSPDLFDDLTGLHAKLEPYESFLQYPTGGGGVVLPKSNLLVLGPNKSLAYAVRTSIAEPGSMRRDPLVLDDAEMARHGLRLAKRTVPLFTSDETLVSYGGWLDHFSAATFMRYKPCQNVDYVASAVAPGQGLHNFQRMAIRAVIDGAPRSFLQANKQTEQKDDPQSPVGQFMTSLEAYRDYGKTLVGTAGRIDLTFDWENPSDRKGDREAFAKAFLSNRAALFVRAFQHAAKNIDDVVMRESAPTLLSSTLMAQPLDALPDADAVAKKVEEMSGELIPKQQP
jgi:hypothetical protein